MELGCIWVQGHQFKLKLFVTSEAAVLSDVLIHC